MRDDYMQFYRSTLTSGKLVARPLPTHFARPVVTAWLPNAPPHGQYTLGPMSHARTVSLAVSPLDSSLLSVSGWCSVTTNMCPENVWVSADEGRRFTDVTGELRRATRTIGQWRPSALLLVPQARKVGANYTVTALLVGTVNGIFVSFLHTSEGDVLSFSAWVRLGSCAQMPLTLVAGLSHEPTDDTIVAATMGRGVYVVHNATRELHGLYVKAAL